MKADGPRLDGAATSAHRAGELPMQPPDSSATKSVQETERRGYRARVPSYKRYKCTVVYCSHRDRERERGREISRPIYILCNKYATKPAYIHCTVNLKLSKGSVPGRAIPATRASHCCGRDCEHSQGVFKVQPRSSHPD